jgi:transcriptional regulator with XRE-family HTH domain
MRRALTTERTTSLRKAPVTGKRKSASATARTENFPSNGAGPADSTAVLALLGERLRELRKLRRMTLSDLAEATGFTKSYLSRIERSQKTPPIASLAKIAQPLNVDLAYFFQDQTMQPRRSWCVVRSEEKRPVVRGGTAFGYDYSSLAYNLERQHMEPFLFHFPADLERHVYFEHEGEEFIYILKGRVEFRIGNETVILEAGDSLYFDSRIPHKGRALDRDAEAITVMFSPENRGLAAGVDGSV